MMATHTSRFTWLQAIVLPFVLTGLGVLTFSLLGGSSANSEAESSNTQTPSTAVSACEMALVEFYNPVCRYCQLMEPVVTKLMTQYGQTFRLNMQNVSTVQASSWADKLGVEGTPTFYLYPAGETPRGDLNDPRPIGVIVGRDPQGLESLLKQSQKALWQAHPNCKR
ncbi:MAG: thioredoxin family protein [Vampirovibrionales bacterium]